MESLLRRLHGVRFARVLVLGSVIVGMISPLKAIVVTPSGSAAALANILVGQTVDDDIAQFLTIQGSPTLQGLSLNDANSSAGLFSDGLTTGIGISEGVLLTSGWAFILNSNSNTGDGLGIIGSAPGDDQLTALAGVATADATILEFSFSTTTPGDLSFNFVFGSEEYNESAAAPFNDVMGVFIDGVNVAVVPGTNTPISIHTVNGGSPLGSGAQNPQYFNNNDLLDGGPFFNIEYDGFTDVLTASSLGLAAGQHTIKFAIADGFDGAVDSGIFIQRGVFVPRTPPQGVPENGASIWLGLVGVVSLVALKRRRLARRPF